MRVGVLDIGSNTVHMLVAGGRPLATTSHRTVLRLMRYLTPDGAIDDDGVRALAPIAARFAALPSPDHVVDTSKAIRSLARLVGYPAPGWSASERMLLPRTALGSWIPRRRRVILRG